MSLRGHSWAIISPQLLCGGHMYPLFSFDIALPYLRKLLIYWPSMFCGNHEEDIINKHPPYILFSMNCSHWYSIPLARHRINGVWGGQSIEKEADKMCSKPHLLYGVLESFLLCKFAFPLKSLHPWDVLEMKASPCWTCKHAAQAGRAPGRAPLIPQSHWLLKGSGLQVVKMMNPNV